MSTVKQASVIFLICFTVVFAKNTLIFWDDVYSAITTTIFASILSAFYYFSVCFVAYFISIVLLKNIYALLAASILATAYHYIASVSGARDANLSSRVNGIDLFISGEITPAGMLDALITPFFMLFVYALISIVRKHLTRK